MQIVKKNVEKRKRKHVKIRVNDGDEWESVKILGRWRQINW